MSHLYTGREYVDCPKCGGSGKLHRAGLAKGIAPVSESRVCDFCIGRGRLRPVEPLIQRRDGHDGREERRE